MNLLTSTPVALLVSAPFIGSFLGVVVMRSINGRPIVFGRSECAACRQSLKPIDLIPVVSWLALRRRCRYCGDRLSTFYPFVELSALIPVAWAAIYMTNGLLVASALFGWILTALALIDWRIQRLPDELTFLLIASGLIVAFLFDRDEWIAHVIGAVCSFAMFVAISYLYRRARKRDGLGHGDAKLLAGIGAWVAWQGIPSVILLGAVAALIAALLLSLLDQRIELNRRIPFGPFLALAAWVVWLYGPLVPA